MLLEVFIDGRARVDGDDTRAATVGQVTLNVLGGVDLVLGVLCDAARLDLDRVARTGQSTSEQDLGVALELNDEVGRVAVEGALGQERVGDAVDDEARLVRAAYKLLQTANDKVL